MNNRSIALSLAILGITVFAASAQGQRRVAFASAPTGRTGAVRMRRARGFFGGSAFAPYYSDYDSEPAMMEMPSPEIIFAEAAQPASPAPASKPSESLVIELQGDHWVRVTDYGESLTSGPRPAQTSNLSSAVTSVAIRTAPASEVPRELPPAVLVFRDGHREEIGKYLITGATIYANADYWSSGSWTRKVPIAELDVPATLKLNQERGARFSLPSGPNEVMMRP